MKLSGVAARSIMAVTVAVTLGLTSSANAELADSAWPKFQHDAQNSGLATVNGPQGPTLQIAWEYRGDSRFRSIASVGPTGVVIGNGKRPMSSLDPTTGLEQWSANILPILGKGKTGLADRSQPAIAADGTAYMGARDNNLWSVASDGEVNWFYKVLHDGDVTTSPTVHPDGTTYMGSEALGSGWLFGLNPDGSVKAFTVLGGSLKNVSPAISTDGSRIFVSIKREAIALNASDLSEIWRCTIADKGFGSRTPNFSPVVYNDGVVDQAVYFGSREGLWAFDATADETYDCTPKWLFVPPNPIGGKKAEQIKSAAAIGPDGTVYLGSSKSKKSSTFYALDPVDGSIKWQHNHIAKGRYVNCNAAIGADGTAYVGFGRTLFAFDGQGDGNGGSVVKWSMPMPGKFETGPSIGGDGILYAAVGKSLFKITD